MKPSAPGLCLLETFYYCYHLLTSNQSQIPFLRNSVLVGFLSRSLFISSKLSNLLAYSWSY